MFNCIFCNKECKNNNSLRNHERLCRLNPDRDFNNLRRSNFNDLGRTAWNKGLTKETDERLRLIASQRLGRESGFKGKKHSIETRRKMALRFQGNNNGNRSKKGYYHGIWCGSSYELIYLIYCLDHNINISRCNKHYEYMYKNEKHIYFPDFVVDNEIIEIKGYHTQLVDIKAASVTDMSIKILYEKDLKEAFSYVFGKYKVNINNIHSLFD